MILYISWCETDVCTYQTENILLVSPGNTFLGRSRQQIRDVRSDAVKNRWLMVMRVFLGDSGSFPHKVMLL